MRPKQLASASRRAILRAGGLAVAGCLSPLAGSLPRRAYAAIPPFRRKVGEIEVLAISDGTLEVPLSFTLPETPMPEVTSLLNAYGLPPGGMPMQTNVTLLKTGNEVILVDAGSGPHFQPTAGKLAENMEAAGIDPRSVTKVVLTHGHADHLWGVFDDFDEEQFPNARYVLSAREWNFWTHPDTPTSVPDWLQGIARGSARILKQLEAKVDLRREGDAIAPGVTYFDTNGHTPGHASVHIESAGERLLIAGDVLSHPAVSFARPDWPMGNDLDRVRGAAVRKRLADQLATDRLAFVGFHLPWPGHGVVERSGSAYRFVPA